LLSSNGFKRVFDNPSRSTDKFFTVLARDNGGQEARLGLAVAKKFAKRAVDRNRLKRLIRESFRNHKAELVGLDLVVLIRPATAKQENSRLFSSLETHWGRLSQ
jgi:ribonuclease P protein component